MNEQGLFHFHVSSQLVPAILTPEFLLKLAQKLVVEPSDLEFERPVDGKPDDGKPPPTPHPWISFHSA